jgi:hypothetical protein
MYRSALGDAPLQKRAGHGVQLLSSLSNLALWIVCFAFVDGTDTMQTAWTVQQTREDVIQQLQPSVDQWEGLLRASGVKKIVVGSC